MAGALALIGPENAHALPPGRAWATTEAMAYPRIATFYAGVQLDVSEAGLPRMIASAQWDTAAYEDWGFFDWADSSWTATFFGNVRGAGFPEPVLSLNAATHILWLNDDNAPPIDPTIGYLIIAEVRPGALAAPDTALVTTSEGSEYSAAVEDSRRWVARIETESYGQRPRARVAYSDTFHVWHELARQGVDEFMCSIAPLSDKSAILVYAGQSGLAYAICENNAWTETGTLDPRPWTALHPAFRYRPSGGLWLMWTEKLQVHVSSYLNGEWQRGDSLLCLHPPGDTFISAWCDASRDTAERPVLAWGDLGYGSTYRDIGCVAFPTDSGWAPGEEIPGSDQIFTTPSVTRDLNGDAWLAWGRLRQFGLWFTHTYVKATADTVWLGSANDAPHLSWRLSEPAPNSWWAVLRASGAADFEPIARVAAGPGLGMSWTDTTAPAAAVLQYRIRRESVDTRYRWESPEVTWWSRGAALALARLSSNPTSGDLSFAVTGADAGPLDVRLYDLQGRQKRSERMAAGGSGRDVLKLDLSSGPRLSAGVYFVRVTDAKGRTSPTLRVVVLR